MMDSPPSSQRRIHRSSLATRLPPEWPEDPAPAIGALLGAKPETLVVLDDDPTGTQTVHAVSLLTEWTEEALRAELASAPSTFYILTNSRSLPLAEAQALNAEIGHNLIRAAAQTGRRFAVVSRSDSTLRGHFPGEVEALAGALGGDFDGWLLIPFFEEGGRFTFDDTHYAADGDWLVPVGETEFARDAAFGYCASELRQWVEEKTGGRIPASAVASIPIEDIRQGGPNRVTERLSGLSGGRVCIVNAASPRDLSVFTQGLLTAEARGQRFLYRTAASFVPVRAGLRPRPLLEPSELPLEENGGGLIVVGSHVPNTSRQLTLLLERSGTLPIEVDVDRLLSDRERSGEIERAAREAELGLRSGGEVVVFTSRRLGTAGEASTGGSLSIGQRVSEGLVETVRRIPTRPRYLLAKGGITASDIATKGLAVKRARVLGQLLPGVPVWQLGSESRFPGLVYIVFPGNVGAPGALADLVAALSPRPRG